jgi:signal transduction histidine kinase
VLNNPNFLPAFMQTDREVTPLWRYVPAVVIPIYCAVLGVLWFRRRSVLDLWLMVVVATLLIELVLLSYISDGTRLSVGWWAGRVCGLISASIVQFALLAETATLYARLARSTAAERQMRETRLVAMEALSASIAHEVNQPVSSMVTSANAALRWLDRQSPDLTEAETALKRIVEDGHRAGAVVENIRAVFKKAGRPRAVLHINKLVAEVVKRQAQQARLARITMETALDPDLPPLSASRIQLEQVMWNLISNAIEAASAAPHQGGRVRITTGLAASGDIVVSVEDCGPGIATVDKERIFAPFFTTKADGMGMGLMLARSVIEAHGGSLWTEPNQPRGAIFRFSLPPRRGPAG